MSATYKQNVREWILANRELRECMLPAHIYQDVEKDRPRDKSAAIDLIHEVQYELAIEADPSIAEHDNRPTPKRQPKPKPPADRALPDMVAVSPEKFHHCKA